MFERFTERARQIIILAQEEARIIQNDHIGMEHIVLGLFREEEGLAAQILTQTLKLNPEDLRAKLQKDKETFTLSGQMPFTVEAKRTLELALREALGLGHNYIGTEHILLACLHNPTDKVEEFFCQLGDNWAEIIRLEVTELLRGPNEKTYPPRDPELTTTEREELKLKDVLADLMTGYRMWKETKVHEDEWTDADEAFRRWIDGSNVSEFL